jgi:hypothetical protein
MQQIVALEARRGAPLPVLPPEWWKDHWHSRQRFEELEFKPDAVGLSRYLWLAMCAYLKLRQNSSLPFGVVCRYTYLEFRRVALVVSMEIMLAHTSTPTDAFI